MPFPLSFCHLFHVNAHCVFSSVALFAPMKSNAPVLICFELVTNGNTSPFCPELSCLRRPRVGPRRLRGVGCFLKRSAFYNTAFCLSIDSRWQIAAGTTVFHTDVMVKGFHSGISLFDIILPGSYLGGSTPEVFLDEEEEGRAFVTLARRRLKRKEEYLCFPPR